MRPPVRLSRRNLPHLPPPLTAPPYSPDSLSPGILHFGLGNFHRAHQAYYLHKLFTQSTSLDYAIIAAGVLPSERSTQRRFLLQDNLYTLVSQSPTRSTPHVISSILHYLPPADFSAILSRLTRPDIRIVTLTITEGGYYLNSNSQPNLNHPALVADARNTPPQTVFNLLSTALKLRRQQNTPPFTVLSCDNLPHNGDITRALVLSLAQQTDPEHATWIRHNVSFPNSMVDGITPETTPRHRQLITDMYGIIDDIPVFREDHIQWVLQDQFTAGRPCLQHVGVEFVDDVSAYEAMKIRILNGGHATIAYPAALLDIPYAHDAMRHELVRAFLDKVEQEEILPYVQVVSGMDAQGYYRRVCERFENPKTEDSVGRLCMDGSNRQPKFIVPSVRSAIEAGGSVDGLALVSAFWCRYCFGVTEGGVAIKKNDPNWEELGRRARRAKEEPSVWLDMESVYGDLAGEGKFREAFKKWVGVVWKEGVDVALRKYLAPEHGRTHCTNE
eukprot:GFKZ01013354.1.p1 GENE.GFKZ01013354.1~~GFKZ01013354.1.p1  ORF type:complete len:501 (+),score=65.07 GFKZ01013354.1:41-1543(+)